MNWWIVICALAAPLGLCTGFFFAPLIERWMDQVEHFWQQKFKKWDNK